MKILWFPAVLVSLAASVLGLPRSCLAAEKAIVLAPVITDVALGEAGRLEGQVVDPQNAAKSGLRVSLQDPRNQELAATTTDRQGYFAFQGVRGGVYQIVTPVGRGIYRAWASGMAPPVAQRGVLMVAAEETVRGEAPSGGWTSWVTHPLVIGGVAATAIAAPVAIYNSGHHRPASP